MKLTLKREELLKPLQQVIGVVERHNAKPILANVLLSVSGNVLSITATDTEVELISSASLNAVVDAAWKITVPGRKFVDICRALPEKSQLELECSGKYLEIKSSNGYFNLATLPFDGFPLTPIQSKQINFAIPQKALLNILKRTSFSIAENHSHKYLNGLLLEIKDGFVLATSSDGHRVSFCNGVNNAVENDAVRIVIPKKCVLELIRLLHDTDDVLSVSLTANYIRVGCDEFTLTSKLIDSKCPDYSKLVPHGGNKHIILNRAMLQQVLTRVGILSNEILRGVRFELSPNVLRITSNNVEQEQAEEVVPIEYNGDNLDIAFNVSYLLDVLSATTTDNISITFKDSESGIMIKECNGMEHCFYMVMPCQI